MALSIVTQEDNMEMMSRYPDKFFDLAIVDPPYGIGAGDTFSGDKRKSGKGAAFKTAHVKKDWDAKIPQKEYFQELFRVSKNQIIWGANYMTEYLPCSMGWIVWDKKNGATNFSDFELAFSSFNVAARKYEFKWNGMLQENMKYKEIKIHPTQKPASLYRWLLQNYAKPGDKFLDTHLGSQSSRIAAYDMGFDFYGCELDKEYFDQGCKRFDNHIKKLQLFTA